MKKILLAVSAALSTALGLADSDIPAWAETAIATTAARFQTWAAKDEVVVIPTITDIHDFKTESATPLDFSNAICHLRIVKRAAEVFGADATADLGDYGFDWMYDESGTLVGSSAPHQAANLQAHRDLINDFTLPHMALVGNHDHGAGTNRITSAQFAAVMNDRDATTTKGFVFGPNRDYGYFDLPAKDTRIFFLNTTESVTTGYWMSDDQLEFLKKHLAECGTGTNPHTVFILTHYCLCQEIGSWKSDWEAQGGKPVAHGSDTKCREAIEAFAARTDGVRLAGVMCGDSHFRNFYEANGVKWAISQGFGGVSDADMPTTPAKATKVSWVDRANETLLDVAAFKPATGEFRVFRIGKGGATADIAFESENPPQVSARAYVQDGLIGMLDGVENVGWGTHDDAATVWKDLAGHLCDFNVQDGVGSFESKGLKKTGSGILARSVLTASQKPSNICQVEAAVSGANAVLPDTSYYVIPFFMDRNQYMAFNGNGSLRQMSFDSAGADNGWKTSETPDSFTYSVAYEPLVKKTGFYIDAAHPTGELFSDRYGDAGTVVTAIKLGARELNYVGKDTTANNYTLNALRFYSRTLSEDEVKQNALLDAYRFRGTVPFDTADYKASNESRNRLLCRVSVPNADDTWAALGGTMTITAQVPAGQVFRGWEGDTDAIVSGTISDPTITINVNRAITLRFSSKKVALSARAYVQEGLIGLLDGLENVGWGTHDDAATVWKDLIGTIGDFTVTFGVGGFTANGLKKTGTGVLAKCLSRLGSENAPKDVYQAEAAVSGINSVVPATSYYVIPFIMGREEYMAFWTKNGTRYLCFDSTTASGLITSEAPDAFTLSVEYVPQTKATNFYVNAAHPVGTAYQDSWGDNYETAIHLGGRELDYESLDTTVREFTLHALRFYKRTLTEAEVKNNNLVDAYRYRGEIPYDTENYKASDAGRTNLLCKVTTPDASEWKELGDRVTVTAKVPTGATFKGWEGDTDAIVNGTSKDATITVLVNRALTLKVSYESTQGVILLLK